MPSAHLLGQHGHVALVQHVEVGVRAALAAPRARQHPLLRAASRWGAPARGPPALGPRPLRHRRRALPAAQRAADSGGGRRRRRIRRGQEPAAALAGVQGQGRGSGSRTRAVIGSGDGAIGGTCRLGARLLLRGGVPARTGPPNALQPAVRGAAAARAGLAIEVDVRAQRRAEAVRKGEVGPVNLWRVCCSTALPTPSVHASLCMHAFHLLHPAKQGTICRPLSPML